ncbi:MAG: FAD-dependent oxidoreductase [Anaerolineae bacterium]|nr:FAD-dependent oxidoreductase [Anaerolineae bacterium]
MNTSQIDNDNVRVLVIGAGAAGLAAGHRLHRAGYEVILLEARDRIGGRIWTNYDLAPHPVEMGAEFIHGDKAVTWSLLREYGLHTLDKVDWEQISVYMDDQLLEPEAFFALPHAEESLWLSHVDEAAEAWRKAGRPDGSIKEILGADKMSKSMQRLLHNRFTTDMTAEPERLGIYGWLEWTRVHDGENEFRLVDGYSRLMERLAEGLDVRLNTPIERLRWDTNGVTAYTQTGEMFEARCAVVTLPLGVLQAGDVTFDPVLPADKQAAIDGLGSGHVNKLILKFNTVFWAEISPALFTTLDSQLWWRPGLGRTNEAPILTGYMGGQAAKRFMALGEEGAVIEGIRHLEHMFGLKGLHHHLEAGLLVAWSSDPYTRMSYSYVPVGGAGLSDQLAAPVERLLFFAGEATSRECASTVHGALESGFRAADEIIG